MALEGPCLEICEGDTLVPGAWGGRGQKEMEDQVEGELEEQQNL